MKARNTIFTTIAAAILATSLLAPVSAETNVEVQFSNGEAYLVETEITQTEVVKPDINVEVTFANGNVYLVDDEAQTTQTEDIDLSGDELAEEVLRLTNQERAEHGLAPLARHQALESAAVGHSQEMRTLNYFSHTSPTAGKNTTRQRVNQYGVNPMLVAENIFECSGYDVELTAKFAVEAFMQSPGHRHNLLNPTATHIGVGFVQTNGTVSVTQVFAAGI
jgi:uncharacterized protein YkwD